LKRGIKNIIRSYITDNKKINNPIVIPFKTLFKTNEVEDAFF